MKRAIVYLVTLILVLTCFSSLAHSDSGKDEKRKNKAVNKEVLRIASSLHSALHSYKNEHRSLCVSELTQKLQFELVKDVTHQVPKNCEVDSLVVGNDELQRWGYFKSVDLEYVKDVEAVITIKTLHAKDVARAFAEMLQQETFMLTTRTDDRYEFKDPQGGHVMDTRFALATQSHIPSKYHYQIQVLEDYLIVEVKEVMSDHWVDSIDPEIADLQQVAQTTSKQK